MTNILARVAALGLATLVAIAPAGAKDRKPVDPDKLFCRSEIPTGSRFTVRRCHTTAEWSQIDGSSAGAADAAMDRATRSGPGTFPRAPSF